jgi:hypothetical protein
MRAAGEHAKGRRRLMITTERERETGISTVNSLARIFRSSRRRVLLASVLVAVFAAARSDAIIAFPTMPVAQYREQHRTVLLDLDTTDATWHSTARYFPSLQLCWAYAEDVADRAPATVVYDCRWSD